VVLAQDAAPQKTWAHNAHASTDDESQA